MKLNQSRITRSAIILIAAAVIIMMSAFTTNAATKTGWKTSGENKYYYYADKKFYKNKIATIDGKKYYFDQNGHLTYGVFTAKNGNNYYSYPDTGAIRQKEGFFTWNKKRYHATQGGVLNKDEFFKVGSNYYYATAKSNVPKGILKIDGSYYFANTEHNHILQTKAGFISYKGKRYYVAKNWKITTGKTFTVSGYTYRANADGSLVTGINKEGNNYYYYDAKGRRKKSKGWITYNKKSYYADSTGKLYRNKIITVSGSKYYMDTDCSVKIGTFYVNGKKYKTNSSGKIIENNKKYAKGIDVSYAQRTINWKKVKADGVEFAIIRCGYRGSTSGKINADSWFMTNIKGATAANVDVGVYFFTEAVNTTEAKQEAQFCINQIKKSGCKVTYPVVIDTENLPGARAAQGKLSRAKRTAIVKAFCDEVKRQGYTPMIYASTSWLNNQLDMSKLQGYKVWVAQYYTKVTYGGEYQCWQYTSSGKVNGISGRVDLDYWYYN